MKIIIPFKETSKRLPGKNFTLFPFIYNWLVKSENVDLSDIYVVSKSEKVKDFVKPYNVNFIAENEKSIDDLTASTLVATDLNLEYFIMLPLTQPIRKHGLINLISERLSQNKNIDFVTTYQKTTDRHIFYLENQPSGEFIHESFNHKGCMCKEYPMIDGALYGMRTEFMLKVMESPDSNHEFWSGNFEVIENDVDFFLDIDNEKDMRQFQILSGYYF